MNKNTKITPFEKDASKWYSDVASNLVINAPVRGTMFFTPFGFKVWNKIRLFLTEEFNKLSIEEVSFPTIFPYEFLAKEKNHIKGFAPEVFKITHIGDKVLNKELVLRPTSEILFNLYFKFTLKSYKELPIKLNQWVSVFRYEKNTKVFLRNTEFYWQEGHTLHKTEEEAKSFSLKMLNLYEKFINDFLLIPTLKGEKSENERFAGANNTYTIETILRDGQALQTATTHYLGQNFANAFSLVLDSNDKQKNFIPFQTSWGVSTRLLGALIMSHADDYGLIFPSKISPYHLVISIIPSENIDQLIDYANKLKDKLTNIDVYIDSTLRGKGYKAMKYESLGIPLRIDIGNNEYKNNSFTIISRIDNSKKEITFEKLNSNLVRSLLDKSDKLLLEKAKSNFKEKQIKINNLKELKQKIEDGFICYAYWSIDDSNLKDEQKIKQDTGATIRLLKKVDKSESSINTQQKSNIIAYFARAY